MDIKDIVASHSYVTAFGEQVDKVIARELKYCKKIGKETSSGDFVGVLQYNTDWIKNVDERIAVQFALANALSNAGMTNEDGRPKLFSPIIVPFHMDSEGMPATQLRIFYYRPKMEEGGLLTQSTILVRCEPYGTEVKFDVASKYANTEAA